VVSCISNLARRLWRIRALRAAEYLRTVPCRRVLGSALAAEHPLAAVGINVVRMLMTLLHISGELLGA
jgi:hypothetical protein